jgi:hypothetical protein
MTEAEGLVACNAQRGVWVMESLKTYIYADGAYGGNPGPGGWGSVLILAGTGANCRVA